MRKIICLLLLLGFFIGCGSKTPDENILSNQNGIENQITEMPQSKSRTYELTKIDYEMGLKCNLCFYKECIIYFLYVEDYTAMVFYKYDVENCETYELGRVEDPFIDSGDIVEYEGNLYYYCNKKAEESGYCINSLYQLDLENNTMTKITEDCTYQTLLYIDVLGTNIVTLKGNRIMERGITYLDLYDLSQKEQTDFKALIQKESNLKTATGEVLHHYSIDNGIIYVLLESRLGESSSWTIEKFDEKGTCFEKIEIRDKEVVRFLNSAEICDFEVMGNYIFIENMSGGGLLLKLSSGEIQIELEDENDLEISIAVDQDSPLYAVVFRRQTGEVWELNIQEQILYEVDLPFKELNIIWIDSDGKAIVSAKEGYYKNY